MENTLSDLLGGGVDFVPRACADPQMITSENSYDLERGGSKGEVANSTSSVLLEKLIVSKLTNKFPPNIHHRVCKSQPFVPETEPRE
jgi:hypothetical protein